MDDTSLQTLLTSTSDLKQASLATRILISRMRIELKAKPEQLPAKLEELKAFLAKNAFARDDLAHI